jgi:hypothetical protein
MLPLLLLAALATAQEPSPDAGATPPAAAPAEPPPVIQQDTSAAAAVPAGPPTTILFPVRAVNIGAMEVRAAEILFRRRYEVAAHQATIPEDNVRAAIAGTDDLGLLSTCVALGCKTWITIDFVRLDKEVFVTLTERDAGATVTQRIEAVASGIDTLPALLDRAARSLATDVPYDKVPAAAPVEGEVNVERLREADRIDRPDLPRSDVNSLAGFKLGVLGPLWPNFGASLTHTFTWRRERKDRFFELDAGVTFPLGISDARQFAMVFLEAGLSHVFPGKGTTAFYAGGGLGPRAGGYDNVGVGLGVYGQAGMLFGRDNRSQPYVQLKVGGDAFTAGSATPYVIAYGGMEAGVGF